ncbi:hypothetical protein [Pseudactinotalea sp.]|uniref:hypothetical protein n=1 Tax=Pseudactinotalea sp. TaxID=1926260 RepID=UPI003B3B4781
MSRSLRDRLLRAGALAAATTAVLAGCAIPVPEVEAEQAPEGPQPALDEPRIDRMLDAIGAAIEAGDEAGTVNEIRPRIDGPAMHTRKAEYRLAAATADSDNATTFQQLTTDPQVVVVSNEDEWPKRVFVFTTIADGMNTPLLLGLEQDDPREDYHLFAWVRLLPEVTTPATAIPAEGSPEVAPDADGLVLSPQQAIEGYADLLENGDDSDVADAFAEDIFRTYVTEDREAISESVEDAGEYTETFQLRQFDPVALETSDGGAIVIGALRSDQTYERTIDDSEMTVGGEIAALAGEDDGIDVETSVTATYYMSVAFYIPPDADDAQIQVLGAERVLDTVTTE